MGGTLIMEYKFRAYGAIPPKAKSMVLNWEESEYINILGFNGGNCFEVTQSTYKTDSKGRTIFIGDVVVVVSDVIWCDGSKVNQAEMHKVEYWDGCPSIGSITFNCVRDGDLMIVGNIYSDTIFTDEYITDFNKVIRSNQ